MAKNTKRRNNKNRYSRRRFSRRRVSRSRVSKKNNKRSRKIHKRKKMRGGMEGSDPDLLIALHASKINVLTKMGLDEKKAENLLKYTEGDLEMAKNLISEPAPAPALEPASVAAGDISPEDAEQIFMVTTGVKEIDKARLYLEIKEYNIKEAVELFNKAPNIRRRPKPAPAPAPAPAAAAVAAGGITSKKDIVVMFKAVTGLPEDKAIIYLTQPGVNFDINKAVALSFDYPDIGGGAVAPAPVAEPVRAAAVLAPKLKDALQGYNVFIAFFRVEGYECQNSSFGGTTEHITFYNFRVNGKHSYENRIFKDPGNTHGNIHEAIRNAWNKMTTDTGTGGTGIILNKVGAAELGTHDAIKYEAENDNCWSYFKNNLLNHIGKALGCPPSNGRYKMNTHIANGFKYFGGLDMRATNYKTKSLMAVVNDHFGEDSWIPHMSTVKSLGEKPLESYPQVINLNPGVDGSGNGWCLRCGIGQGENIQLL